MAFVVLYGNAPMYRGLDEYAATAESLSNGSTRCSGQDRVFMTTPELAKAHLFQTEDQADAYSRRHPVLDESHKVARVVEVMEQTQVVNRALVR